MAALIFFLLFTALLSFAISWAIVFLSKLLKAGQSIREEGPALHKMKAGTPTFGGIAVMLSFLIAVLIFVDLDAKTLTLVLTAIGFSLIGLADDLLKVTSGKNEGLLPVHKMGAQIFLSLVFGTVLLLNFHDMTASGLLKTLYFDLPWFYLPLIAFMMVGFSNATNLTDGLDGLLGGTALIAFTSFAILSYNAAQYDVFGMCLAMIGALAGFLILNFNPAKIFMGDVGSLGAGALLAGVAVILHKELLLVLIGGIFVIETLSVIAQVTSYKLFKKRIFKMSPLHHHFELSGMGERKIVYMFWGLGAVLGILGVIL
ncbi:MAG: phospho-N-acetylmuramoyl-pentapeptide-transferase [Candidatus Margulisiibacteriota bacterium]